MAPSKRPSLEMTVTSSTLFGLPLEIRIMIYTQLLHSTAEILIPSNQFKRQRNCKGVGIYKHCALCGRSFGGIESYMSHQYLGCGQSPNLIRWPKGPEQAPSLWPALLRTCRFIHREAAPVLYRSNTFCFEDAATPNFFRWSTDQAQAPFIERVHVLMPFTRHRIPKKRETYHGRNPWWQYCMGNPFSLATDFPHLKGITITLGRGLAVASSQDVRTNFELFAKHVYRLNWLQVIGLNDPTLLKYLYSVVERADEDHGRKGMQTEITEYEECIGWKNAIIWWGLPGEEAPCKPTPYAGDRRVRNRLFRIVDGNVVSYAAGHSFLDPGE
ncbi:hypothetical protein HO173_012070 [Letharia columbiana]|uniref:C2H2-type domain-containing protein n=1 Tax=Letharia columbiana TaxID=112416 RepID=A0A8H6CQH3_9LECA|nr:uncharacterized protein HO173_012070 [Letharia columbiana]KAF6227740.1 hypothetical protein HO173_012070 [Letharia columbiana]